MPACRDVTGFVIGCPRSSLPPDDGEGKGQEHDDLKAQEGWPGPCCWCPSATSTCLAIRLMVASGDSIDLFSCPSCPWHDAVHVCTSECEKAEAHLGEPGTAIGSCKNEGRPRSRSLPLRHIAKPIDGRIVGRRSRAIPVPTEQRAVSRPGDPVSAARSDSIPASSSLACLRAATRAPSPECSRTPYGHW